MATPRSDRRHQREVNEIRGKQAASDATTAAEMSGIAKRKKEVGPVKPADRTTNEYFERSLDAPTGPTRRESYFATPSGGIEKQKTYSESIPKPPLSAEYIDPRVERGKATQAKEDARESLTAEEAEAANARRKSYLAGPGPIPVTIVEDGGAVAVSVTE